MQWKRLHILTGACTMNRVKLYFQKTCVVYHTCSMCTVDMVVHNKPLPCKNIIWHIIMWLQKPSCYTCMSNRTTSRIWWHMQNQLQFAYKHIHYLSITQNISISFICRVRKYHTYFKLVLYLTFHTSTEVNVLQQL